MRTHTTRTVIASVAATLAVLVIVALIFIYSGTYDVAATEPHLGAVRWALNTTQVRAVKARGDEVPAPPTIDSALVRHGFEHYREMCVVCHGAPGVERGEFGQGLNPTPPELSRMAARYTPQELFWVVKHGLKMTGMPAFGPTHSDEEIWAIVAFLERLPQMSPEEYQRWVDSAGRSGGHGHASTGGDGHDEGHTHESGTSPH